MYRPVIEYTCDRCGGVDTLTLTGVYDCLFTQMWCIERISGQCYYCNREPIEQTPSYFSKEGRVALRKAATELGVPALAEVVENAPHTVPNSYFVEENNYA